MKKVVPILLFTCLFAGCLAPYQTFKMDYEYPPQIYLPDSIKYVVIVNNAKEQPLDKGWTLIDVDQEPRPAILERGPLLPVLEKAMITKAKEKTGAKINKVKHDVTDSLSSDMLQLIIDDYSWNSLVKLTTEDEWFKLFNLWSVQLKVRFLTKDFGTQEYTMTDTLSWTSRVQKRPDGSYRSSYNLEDLLKKASEYTGSQLILRALGDKWKEERQIFASGDLFLAEAYRFAQKNQWNEAESIWLDLHEESQSKHMKGRAAYNLALHYERKGLPDIALSWIDKACDNFETGYPNSFQVMALDYKEILERIVSNNQ